MITKELIIQGINEGLVRFILDPNLNTGTVCQIGENWFYFGGIDAESEMPDDFLKHSDKREIVNLIYDTLEEFRMYENQDEYAYYDAYLHSYLPQKCHEKLRLILFTECNRGCPGCCNKQWDIEALPVCSSFKDYSLIMLTGGEPMLHPDIVTGTIRKIRKQNPEAKIVLYTAYLKNTQALLAVLPLLDGITVTLHDKNDIIPFRVIDHILSKKEYRNDLSLRLNHFAEAEDIDFKMHCDWKVKKHMEWIENCPLPDGEVLMRL